MPNDANMDGRFNIADLVAVESWILGKNSKIEDWEMADSTADNVINALDLSVMRKELLTK